MERAAGSRVWDVDGNEYVDYLMSYGALILGHGHPVVKEAVESVLEDVGTTVTGTPTEIEVEYGRMLRDLYHRDGLVRFTNSGLEATLLAVRLAKAHTGRKVVAKFEGHYHDANDQLLVSYNPPMSDAGSPSAPTPVSDSLDVDDSRLAESLVLPFNDWESAERLISANSERLACVILEPFEEGVIPGETGFMRRLRNITSDLRIPLIYDEVKTGFRVRLGGASEFYSITPDIACLGKIIGGGLPVGAVVGETKIMNHSDPRGDKGPTVFHSGTFNGNPLVLNAGLATVETLGREGNFGKVVDNTTALRKSFSAAFKAHQVEACIVGEGAMFGVYMTPGNVSNYRDVRRSDLRLRRALDPAMICRGTYLKPMGRYCLSLAHSGDDGKLTTESLDGALDELCSAMPN